MKRVEKMKNGLIQDENFVTDMALDNLAKSALENIAKHKELQYGIKESVVNIKDKDLAVKVGRQRGVYVTYDFSAMKAEKGAEYLSRALSSTLLQLAGNLSKKATVLVVGLGNPEVLADSLGARVCNLINCTRGGYGEGNIGRYSVCSLTAGVSGVTGIESQELVGAINDKIKPAAIILVDTLATSSSLRLGASLQVSSAGIAPASGVGRDRPRIDRSVTGVPTISVGVPLVLSMNTLIRSFVHDYDAESGRNSEEIRIAELTSRKKLSALVVSPKEVKPLLELSAMIIADGINRAFVAF